MLINPYPGLFVDIEGIDGSGQSTQVSRVAENLRKMGYLVTITRAAPKETPIGSLIRQALNHHFKISVECLEFLFAADHSYRQDKEIIPVLKNGGVVVADRSIWSFIAFGALKMDHDWLFSLVKNLIFPDLTIFLHVRAQVAMKRIGAYRKTRDYFEKEKILEKVWKNYQWLAKKFSDRIWLVDGEKPKKEVTEEILGIIKKHPKFQKIPN